MGSKTGCVCVWGGGGIIKPGTVKTKNRLSIDGAALQFIQYRFWTMYTVLNFF